jgi:hypothetical protein
VRDSGPVGVEGKLRLGQKATPLVVQVGRKGRPRAAMTHLVARCPRGAAPRPSSDRSSISAPPNGVARTSTRAGPATRRNECFFVSEEVGHQSEHTDQDARTEGRDHLAGVPIGQEQLLAPTRYLWLAPLGPNGTGPPWICRRAYDQLREFRCPQAIRTGFGTVAETGVNAIINVPQRHCRNNNPYAGTVWDAAAGAGAACSRW